MTRFKTIFSDETIDFEWGGPQARPENYKNRSISYRNENKLHIIANLAAPNQIHLGRYICVSFRSEIDLNIHSRNFHYNLFQEFIISKFIFYACHVAYCSKNFWSYW